MPEEAEAHHHAAAAHGALRVGDFVVLRAKSFRQADCPQGALIAPKPHPWQS